MHPAARLRSSHVIAVPPRTTITYVFFRQLTSQPFYVFQLVVTVVKDYLNKLARNSTMAPSEGTIPAIPVRESTVSIRTWYHSDKCY